MYLQIASNDRANVLYEVGKQLSYGIQKVTVLEDGFWAKEIALALDIDINFRYSLYLPNGEPTAYIDNYEEEQDYALVRFARWYGKSPEAEIVVVVPCNVNAQMYILNDQGKTIDRVS